MIANLMANLGVQTFKYKNIKYYVYQSNNVFYFCNSKMQTFGQLSMKSELCSVAQVQGIQAYSSSHEYTRKKVTNHHLCSAYDAGKNVGFTQKQIETHLKAMGEFVRLTYIYKNNKGYLTNHQNVFTFHGTTKQSYKDALTMGFKEVAKFHSQYGKEKLAILAMFSNSHDPGTLDKVNIEIWKNLFNLEVDKANGKTPKKK